jgi:hypothetical protein
VSPRRSNGGGVINSVRMRRGERKREEESWKKPGHA